MSSSQIGGTKTKKTIGGKGKSREKNKDKRMDGSVAAETRKAKKRGEQR